MTSVHDRREFEGESDPLLDSLLDEVLGGHAPPDLKSQILARWQADSAPSANEEPGEVMPPPIVVHLKDATAVRSVGRARRAGPAWWVISGACALALLTTWWAFSRNQAPLTKSPLANRNASGVVSPRTSNRVATPQATDRESTAPVDDAVRRDPADDSSDAAVPGDVRPSDEQDESSSQPLPSKVTSPTQLAQLDDATVIAQLNAQLQSQWQQQQVLPAQEVADEVWCRRAYQHVIGREPYANELRDFLRTEGNNRRVDLANRLLGPSYAQEFSARWAERWTDWLLQGIAGDSRAFRTGLQNHLAAMLSENRSYDQICAELITASGTNDPTLPDFNGATNYLLALNEKTEPSDLTSQVCRAMIGQRLSCAQCHDDRVHGRSQADFWQLTATLNSIQIDVLRPGRRARLQDRSEPTELSLSFVDSEGEPSRAVPGGWDGKPLTPAADRPLRAQLAEQFVTSDDFARAAVNRVWTAFLQYGFALPVDDLGRHNPVSNPELLDLLSDQFAAHDYNLKDLMRWITLSDAFNRSDVIMTVNSKDAPAEGGQALFSRFYHRPVLFSGARQGLDQLVAGNSPQVTYSNDDAERRDLIALRYGDPQSPASDSSISSSDRMGQLLPSHYLSLISALAAGGMSEEQQFEHAYRVVLGRAPRADEQAQAAAIYKAAEGNSVTALERIFWVLLNSSK